MRSYYLFPVCFPAKLWLGSFSSAIREAGVSWHDGSWIEARIRQYNRLWRNSLRHNINPHSQCMPFHRSTSDLRISFSVLWNLILDKCKSNSVLWNWISYYWNSISIVIQFQTNDIKFHTNDVHFQTSEIQFHADEIQI